MAKVTHSTPEARTPPMEASDEATRKTLQMAREQGDALKRAAEHMMKEEAHDGQQTHVGDYLVGYAVEEAEGLWKMQGGELKWSEPDEENVHVEIAVSDAADGRFIPGLAVHATLVTEDGTEVGTHRQDYLWHPWLYHYGRNWTVPGDGRYTLRVRIEPPAFHRHDKKNGRRFEEAVEVEFQGVQIKTGQKKS